MLEPATSMARRHLPLLQRGYTENLRRTTLSRLQHLRDPDDSGAWSDAPSTWEECVEAELGTPEMPCPYARCKFNLILDVLPNGNLHYNWNVEPDDIEKIPHTCILRLIEDGELSTDQISEILGLSRAQVRNIELSGIAALKKHVHGDDVVLRTTETRRRGESCVQCGKEVKVAGRDTCPKCIGIHGAPK